MDYADDKLMEAIITEFITNPTLFTKRENGKIVAYMMNARQQKGDDPADIRRHLAIFLNDLVIREDIMDMIYLASGPDRKGGGTFMVPIGEPALNTDGKKLLEIYRRRAKDNPEH
jgi:hypothetical protein